MLRFIPAPETPGFVLSNLTRGNYCICVLSALSQVIDRITQGSRYGRCVIFFMKLGYGYASFGSGDGFGSRAALLACVLLCYHCWS